MRVQPTIICSECDVDLKDKRSMEKLEQSNRHVPVFNVEPKPVDEKTLTDIIRNAQAAVAISGIAHSANISTSSCITGLSEEQLRIINTPYAVSRQVLRNDWVIANEKVKQSILEGNMEGYISVCSCVKEVVHTIVLCEISKTCYSDGSYKIHYNPLTINRINRMPE